jgi:hypothetical protein
MHCLWILIELKLSGNIVSPLDHITNILNVRLLSNCSSLEIGQIPSSYGVKSIQRDEVLLLPAEGLPQQADVARVTGDLG